MAAKVKVTVSIDAGLLEAIGRVSRRTGKARSQLVEEALRLWRRRQLDEALKAGYRAMAKEDRVTAEQHLRAGWDAIR